MGLPTFAVSVALVVFAICRTGTLPSLLIINEKIFNCRIKNGDREALIESNRGVIGTLVRKPCLFERDLLH